MCDCQCGHGGRHEGRSQHWQGGGRFNIAPPWAWAVGGEYYGPTKAEYKASLEAFRQHLEARLAEVSEELKAL